MYVAPRGPLELANGSFDRSDSYERDLLSWREAADTEAHRFAEMCPESGRIHTYMQFVQGDHWSAIGSRRPPYRSRIAINKVGTARLNHIASATDTKPDIDISCEVPQYEEVAKMIDSVLRYEWVANKMDLALATAIDIDAMAGTAFWKIGAAAPGMMKVIPCGPDTVLPIQPGFTIQDSTAVKYRTYKSLTDVILKYPTRAKELAGQARSYDFTTSSKYARPPHLDDITWNRLAPGMQKLLGQRVTISEPLTGHGFFKSVEWQEYWIEDPSINESQNVVTVRDPGTHKDKHNWWYEVKPGQRLYPRKRLVIFAGNSLIYDGPAPYWHGLYPFACLRTNPAFWSFWGLSRYRDLLPINSAINEVVAGVMDMLKRAINPVMMAKANTVDEESFRKFFYDMPGARMYVRNSTANLATDVRWMETPALPPWILPFLSQVLGIEFDKLAGDLDVMKLGGKEQVPGGDTLEQMRDAQQAPKRLASRYIESFLTDAGVQAVSNIIQFYGLKRLISILGPAGASKEQFIGSTGTLYPYDKNDAMQYGMRFDFWRNFPLIVKPGSMHGGARDRMKAMAITLFAQGAISIEKLHEILEIRDPAAVEKYYAMMQGGAMQSGPNPRLTRGQRNGDPV